MKIAFSTIACPNWTWLELLNRAREYGYAGVEIRLLAGSLDVLEAEPFLPENTEQSLAEIADRGVRIACVASSVRFDYADPAERQEQAKVGKAYIDLCQRLGSPVVRVFGDSIPKPGLRDQVIAQVAEGLQALGEYAEDHGVDVVIETHGDFSDSLTIQATMQQVTSPAVGVLWDTHHPWRFHGEAPAETFERIGRWVRHTHWKDSVTQTPDEQSEASAQAAAQAHSVMSGHRHADYALFGRGEFPAAEVLKLLAGAGYEGWYSLEWEKAWHPELADPEIALPPFPELLSELKKNLAER